MGGRTLGGGGVGQHSGASCGRQWTSRLGCEGEWGILRYGRKMKYAWEHDEKRRWENWLCMWWTEDSLVCDVRGWREPTVPREDVRHFLVWIKSQTLLSFALVIQVSESSIWLLGWLQSVDACLYVNIFKSLFPSTGNLKVGWRSHTLLGGVGEEGGRLASLLWQTLSTPCVHWLRRLTWLAPM